jgi:sugar phosphate isomerase/epimerase
MKIGVQTANIIGPANIAEGFQLIRECGFDCVDFNMNQQYEYRAIVEGKPSDLFSRSDEEIFEFYRPYKEAAEASGVAFSQAHAPFPSYVASGPGNEYVMDAIQKSIRVCGYIGIPYLVVHPHFLGYNEKLSPEEEWRINIERYGALIADAKASNVTICLENMFAGHKGRIYSAICSDMNESVRYIDALNELAGEKRFAFCLDIGHSLLCSNDIYSDIRTLGGRLEALHIHDNNGVADQHLFPYMGIVDWDRFCKGLKDIGYKGVLSFETYNGLNAFDKALKVPCLELLAATGRLFASKISG